MKISPEKGFPLDYPIQSVQPIYYYTESLEEGKNDIVKYGERLNRPFKCYYDFKDNTVKVNSRIKTYYEVEF